MTRLYLVNVTSIPESHHEEKVNLDHDALIGYTRKLYGLHRYN